jgi:hypothetical protein
MNDEGGSQISNSCFIVHSDFDLKLLRRDTRIFSRSILMIDERTQHLELVAASLTQSYYTVHTGGSPDHRDILETYLFLLEALIVHDNQRPGESPLAPGDTLAPFEADTNKP